MSPLLFPQGIHPRAAPAPTGPDIGDVIANAIRINDNDSAFLSRTPGAAGNSQIFTITGWVKRGNLGDATQNKFFNASRSGFSTGIGTQDAGDLDRLFIVMDGASSITSAVFRDPGAWFHFHWAVDVTQATGANRSKLAINGVPVTYDQEQFPTQNVDLTVNRTEFHGWARNSAAGNQFYDGYLADCHLTDGIVTVPTDFGRFSADTGEWVRKDYTGAYGSQGSRLDFAIPPGTGSGAGTDASGNGNDWAESGLAANDQVPDTPTLNYPVLLPISANLSGVTISDGNLRIVASNGSNILTPLSFTSGKFYFEVKLAAFGAGESWSCGVTDNDHLDPPSSADGRNKSWTWDAATSLKYDHSTSGTALGSSPGQTDTVMCAIDADSGKIWWGSEGTWFGSGDPAAGTNEAFSNLAGKLTPMVLVDNGDDGVINFGQLGFNFTPPTGFLALNTDSLADPAIVDPADFFTPHLYAGDSADAHAITGVGFQPDLVWAKDRDAANTHSLFDSARGPDRRLRSDGADAETTPTDMLRSFDVDGFTLDDDATVQAINRASNYVAWNWKAGALPGFEAVLYTGTGVIRTVPHSLGAAPKMMLIKKISTGAESWIVYSDGVGPTGNLFLDLNSAVNTSINVFNDTAPTTTEFTLGNSNGVNANLADYVAYLFAEVPGFSKIGIYTGNGIVDGPFIGCGFRPAYVMLKRTNAAQEWQTYDAARSPFNEIRRLLRPNETFAEVESSDDNNLDFVSNGIKIREDNGGMNGSGSPYIFAAFAEMPGKFARARC